MGFFQPSVTVVVIAPMIMKFGTGIKLDVFYTTVLKKMLRDYHYVIMIS